MAKKFKTKHLEKLAIDPKYCQKKLGTRGAKEFLKSKGHFERARQIEGAGLFSVVQDLQEFL